MQNLNSSENNKELLKEAMNKTNIKPKDINPDMI